MSRKDKVRFAIVVLAQIALVGLRFSKVIDWHWAWVLSPLLFCAGLFLLVVAVASVIVILGK